MRLPGFMQKGLDAAAQRAVDGNLRQQDPFGTGVPLVRFGQSPTLVNPETGLGMDRDHSAYLRFVDIVMTQQQLGRGQGHKHPRGRYVHARQGVDR